MTQVVLDASAILALLKGERGAAKVASIIADASVSAINQAEIVGHFVRLGAPLDEIRTMLGALPYEVVPVDEALAELSQKVPTLVITRGAAGALAVEGGRTVRIPAMPVPNVVDTTGAGDLFAAGFLTARVKGAPLAKCLSTGSIAAAEIISHYGARPEADLKEWIEL